MGEMTLKRKKDAAHDRPRTMAEILGPSVEEERASRQNVTFVEGDELVMQVQVSKDDGQASVVDVEAVKAKEKLRAKIRNTRDAIWAGVSRVLRKQIGGGAEALDEKQQEMVIEKLSEPLKEKLGEYAKGKIRNAKIKGGGAVGRMLKERLGNEATAMVGKAAGAIAVVGAVKDVVDAVGEAEFADFTARTFDALILQVQANIKPAFDGYERTVDGMDGQTAVDAAAAETADPWITETEVAAQIQHLFDGALIISGVLKGHALFDKVQEVLHPTPEDGEE